MKRTKELTLEAKKLHRLTMQLEFDGREVPEPFGIEQFKGLVDASILVSL